MSTEWDDAALDDSFEIDTTVAHPARRYNYWLGGKDNFEADRASGDAWGDIYPTVRLAALENRRFLERAVTFLVKEAGIRQFLDIGTGIPSANPVHEAAQSIAPESRVVYVDNDPIVLAHARRLLSTTSAGATAYIHADVREPGGILGNPDLHKTLDLSRPVALMVVAVMHFVEDADDPYGCIATLAGALAPGSYVAMSHGTTDFLPADRRAKFEQWVEQEERSRNRDPYRQRTEPEFARFFEGMELVPPGIVALPDWRSEVASAARLAPADASAYCAVARIS